MVSEPLLRGDLSVILYHYCSVESFEKILESKVLWLTDVTQSNDSEEVFQTFRILWGHIRQRLLGSDLNIDIVSKEVAIIDKQFELELLIDLPFGCCFCKNGDELQQWKEYGDNTKGISIGFNFDWFPGLLRQLPHPKTSIEMSIGYDDVIYNCDEIEDWFFELCYNSISQIGLPAWILAIRPTFKYYSAFIKNNSFHGEYEARIVYFPLESHDLSNNVFNITGPIDNPKKHYCLPWGRSETDFALCEVILGCNCEMDPDIVKGKLFDSGLNRKIKISKSSSSYRIIEHVLMSQ